MENPMMAGLQAAEQSRKKASETELENPASMSEDGATLFIDKNKFPGGCKEGDTVMVKATVKSVGSKIGIVPDEVTTEKPQGQAPDDPNADGEKY